MRHLLAALMLMASAPFFCQDDCDLFNIQELASENQELHDSIAQFSVDTIIRLSEGTFEVQLSNGTTFTQVQGCTDPAYTEYSASANTDDSSCATLIVNGCTNPAYTEFDASANTDNGSCVTAVVNGCTDANYIEYNAAANTDDGSCATLIVNGCTNPAYTEFDASANTDDGSCVTAVVNGCTDANYIEYNAAANTDDGSCATLIVNGCTNPAYTEFDASANTDDGSCATQVAEGCTDPTDINYNAAANTDDGSCASYSCSSVEVDGYTYAVVEIGEQCWFAENLRTTVYADGEPIPEITNPQTWLQLSSGGHCVYNNNGGNLATYGRLYNWYAVDDARGLCPSGWHVPTNQEWEALDYYITSQGLGVSIGTALKSTTGWDNNGNGQDIFGFSALPGGYRYSNIGYFMNVGNRGYWWSASGGYRRITSSGSVIQVPYTASNGYSVRCLRDAE